jgi:hypothetical protein
VIPSIDKGVQSLELNVDPSFWLIILSTMNTNRRTTTTATTTTTTSVGDVMYLYHLQLQFLKLMNMQISVHVHSEIVKDHLTSLHVFLHFFLQNVWVFVRDFASFGHVMLHKKISTQLEALFALRLQ